MRGVLLFLFLGRVAGSFCRVLNADALRCGDCRISRRRSRASEKLRLPNSSGGVLLEVKPRRYDLRVPGTRISEIVRERRGITTETSFVLGAIIQDERT